MTDYLVRDNYKHKRGEVYEAEGALDAILYGLRFFEDTLPFKHVRTEGKATVWQVDTQSQLYKAYRDDLPLDYEIKVEVV